MEAPLWEESQLHVQDENGEYHGFSRRSPEEAGSLD